MAVVADGTIVVDADGDPFLRSLDRIARQGERRMTKAGTDFGSNFGKSMGRGLTNTMGGISKFLTVAGAAGPAVMALGGALSATAAAASTLAASVGPPLAAAMTTTAGTMLAAGQGAIFAKVAFKDMGAAIDGDTEALKKFGPEGRKLVKTLQGTSKEMDGVRKSVQGGLFPGLDRAVSSLATSYFPLLNTAGEQTGTVLGRLADQGAKMLTSGPWKADFATLTKANADNLGVLGTTVFNLLDIIRNLLVTSAPLTKRFLDWAAGASAAVAALTESGRKTGDLAAWFQRAGDMAASWGRILGNLGSALADVFSATNSGGSADAMLDKLEELTQKWEEWTGSVEGNSAMAKWFQSGQENLEAMARLLGDLGAGLSDIGGGAKLAPLLDQINAMVVPPLLELLTNASASGALDSMVAALGSILEVLSGLASNGSFTAFAETIKAVADAAGWVLTNVPGASTAMAGLLTVMGSAAALKMVGLGGAVEAAAGGITGLLDPLKNAAVAHLENAAQTAFSTAMYKLSHSTLATWIGVKWMEVTAWAKTKAAMVGHTIATKASIVATKAMVVATKLLNFAMSKNPVAIVIKSITVLVGLFVLLYKKNETFRNFVDATWARIKEVVAAVVDWLVNTAWPAIQKVWSSISSGVQTLWGWMKTAWEGIKSAIASAWAFIRPIFALWEWYFGMLGKAFTFFKDIAVMVWQIIGVLFQAGWVGLKIVFDAISNALGWVGDKFQIFKDAVAFAWDSIKAYAKAAWDWLVANVWNPIAAKLAWVQAKFEAFKAANVVAWNVLKAMMAAAWAYIKVKVWDPMAAGLDWLKGRYENFKNNVGIVWDYLKMKLRDGWTWIQINVFDKFKAGLDSLKSKFETVKNNIGTVWDGLKDKAKAPIKFIIETVLNGGLIKGFNWLADKVGGTRVANIPMPFARGGILPGYTPGRDVHQFYSPTGGRLSLSGGEPIMRPEFGRVVGKGWVDKMNLAARRGGTSGVRKALGFADGGIYPGGHQAFADGGVLGWIKSKAASAFDWMREKGGAIWNAVTNPLEYLKKQIPSIPGSTKLAEFGRAAKDKALGFAVSKIKSLWASFKKVFEQEEATRGGSSYGVGVGHALSRVRSALLPGLSITSTYRSPSRNRAVGGHPQSLHMNAANPAVDIGGPTYLLDRFYAILKRMGGWRQLKWRVAGHFDHIHAAKMGGIVPPFTKSPVFDRGGTLRPGLNLVRNNTGANEHLVPAEMSGTTIVNVELNLNIDDIRQLADVADLLERIKTARVTERKTARSGRVSA